MSAKQINKEHAEYEHALWFISNYKYLIFWFDDLCKTLAYKTYYVLFRVFCKYIITLFQSGVEGQILQRSRKGQLNQNIFGLG